MTMMKYPWSSSAGNQSDSHEHEMHRPSPIKTRFPSRSSKSGDVERAWCPSSSPQRPGRTSGRATTAFLNTVPQEKSPPMPVRDLNALKAEMAMENPIISADWRKRMPVVPGKIPPEQMRNQRQRCRHRRARDLRPGRHGKLFTRRAFSPNLPLNVLDHHDHIVQPPSPVTSMFPKQGQVLIEKTSNLTKARMPIGETRSQ